MDALDRQRQQRSDPEKGRAEALAARAREGFLDARKLRLAARLGHQAAMAVVGLKVADLRRHILAREEDVEDFIDEPLRLIGDQDCWGLCYEFLRRFRGDFEDGFEKLDPEDSFEATLMLAFDEALEVLGQEARGQACREQRMEIWGAVDELCRYHAATPRGSGFGFTVAGFLFERQGYEAVMHLFVRVPVFSNTAEDARSYLDFCLSWIAERLLA